MSKILLVSAILTLSLSSCRNNSPSEVGFSCQRLSSCYSAYGSMITSPQVKISVENAQKSGLESSCISAINEIQINTKQSCPF